MSALSRLAKVSMEVTFLPLSLGSNKQLNAKQIDIFNFYSLKRILYGNSNRLFVYLNSG